MKTRILTTGAMLVFLVGTLLLTQSLVFAEPLSICVSTAGGGLWTTPGTWQFCSSGATVPAATDDIYIIGPVTTAGATTAASVTVDNGGTLNPGANLFTASNLTVNAGGAFSGRATITGNLTNNGTFSGAGQAVTVNGDVSNAAIFNAGAGAVTLKGNLTNNGTFNHNDGTVTFAGTSTQSVGGTNAVTFNHLTLDNSTGLTLNTNATLNGTLTLTTGDLSTGDKILTFANSTTTVVAATGRDVVGNVKRSHAFSTGTNYIFNNPNTLINFGTLTTAPTDLTVNLVKSAPGGLANAVPRTYSITAGGTPVFNATLRLHYKTSEGGFTTEADLRAWRQEAGLWQVKAGSDTSNTDNSYVTATGVNGFSLWAISENSPTAVALASFTTTNPSDQNLLLAFGVLGALVLTVGVRGTLYRFSRTGE